jgi:hypothetical protein
MESVADRRRRSKAAGSRQKKPCRLGSKTASQVPILVIEVFWRCASPRPAVILLLILCLSAAAWGESGASGRSIYLLPLSDLTTGQRDPDRLQAVSDAVAAAFRDAGYRLEGQESTEPPADAGQGETGGAAAAALARAAGADLAVGGFLTVVGERILVALSVYEADSAALAAGFVRSWRSNLSFYTSLRRELHAMALSIPAPRASEKAPDQPEAPTAEGEVSFISQQEGMQLLLSGEKSLGRIENGRLAVRESALVPGTRLVVEKRLPGYHPARQTVVAGRDVVLTPIARRSTMAVEASWTAGEFAGGGAAFRYCLQPDSLYLSAGLTVFGEQPASQGAPLMHADVLLLLGQYLFFPPESLFRMGVAAGAGVVVTAALGAVGGPYTDVYWDMASLWTELSFPTVSVFLRADIRCTLDLGLNLLGRTIMIWGAKAAFPDGTTIPFYFVPLTLGVAFRL